MGKRQLHHSSRLSRRLALALVLRALAGCDYWPNQRVIPSGTGVYAVVGVPTPKGARSVCLADRPIRGCPPSLAVFDGAYAREGDVYWRAPEVLVITQSGGLIWKRPPREPITIAGRPVTVRLEYRR